MAKSAKVAKISKSPSLLQKHWWKIGISLLFVTGLVFLGYNKYLDRQNVSDMKQLLSDFEKLKTDVEAETGEKLYLGVKCGELKEKFIKTPACYVYLESAREKPTDLSKVLYNVLPKSLDKNRSCDSFEGVGFIFSNSNRVVFSCYPLAIRISSRDDIEKLVSPYTN
jgi:hypothetical protein